MKNLSFNLPDKLFGLESDLLKLLLVPVVLIVLFLISLKFVILPRIASISDLNNQSKEIKNEIKSVEEKKNYLASVDKDELNKDADYLNSAVLGEKESYFLIGVVRSIADKYGFQIKSFSTTPGKLKNEETVKISETNVMTKIPVDVVLVGAKDKYLELIMALEKSLPIIFIDKFEINTAVDMVELDLTVSSYCMNGKSPVDIAKLSLADLTLKKEELDFLKKISQFEKTEGIFAIKTDNIKKEYVKYDRPNPFSL